MGGYGPRVATRKVTVTIDGSVLATLRGLAAQAGLPLSTYVTRAVEHHARIQDGLAAMREWEQKHGAFTYDELTEADIDIARAKAAARPPPSRAS
jgi:hypothetical protein